MVRPGTRRTHHPDGARTPSARTLVGSRMDNHPEAKTVRKNRSGMPCSRRQATNGRPPGWRCPGRFPHSHDSLSKAYTQLARTWYRSKNLEALELLQSDLATWKDAQTRDHELVDVIQAAIQLKKGDLEAVAKGFEKRSADRRRGHA